MDVRAGRELSFGRWLARLTGQQTLFLAVGAFLLGLLGNVLANVLGNWSLWGLSGNAIILVALLLAVLALYGVHRWRIRNIRLSLEEQQPTGKAGLIVLLSTINPRLTGTPEEIRQQRAEFETQLDRICETEVHLLADADLAPLWETNLVPALRALEYHWGEGTLRDCWMIGTPDEVREDGRQRRGSACLGRVLEQWFYHLHPRHTVHFAAPKVVGPRDYQRLSEIVNSIFREAPYQAQHIICDITGGLKMMSVGAALACLSPGRAMQYMASDRDWKGDPIPKGEMKPVLLDVSPILATASVPVLASPTEEAP